VNYLAEQIEAYLRKQTHFRDWTTVLQAEPRGTGDALRSCREQIRSEHFLVMNGDDLYGAADVAALAARPAGVLAYPVDDPPHWGIAFLKPDGTLEKLVEKPKLEGRRLANTGVYVFPREVFEIPLTLSARGEYEITDYVTKLAEHGTVSVVTAKFWLPIGNVEAWQKAQTLDLAAVMK
jgi:bifunctional UDP-N-acetylglucosamine pyrophosphorylase/glucosamine-1-phosphate N-acetyltransferase